PTPAELYPSETLTFVESPVLGRHLCGAFRPGHFRGVGTVVLKLFNIVQPDVACFGEKDAQQLAIIRRMVSDFNVPVEIVPVRTVREADGLALSSRNKHLSREERRIAPMLSQALQAAVAQLDSGETRAATIRQTAHSLLEAEPVIRIEYLDVVDPESLAPIDVVTGRALLAGAIWLGNTRLIDNIGWTASSTVPTAKA
ncbi:MAG: pantoate--beta-alanine ligase, partial [Bryobacterales bacterium]|nr:pantoate--beta-alanine ligase [Bryobacterales bacterium]